MRLRPAAVAGSFYPGEASALEAQVHSLLARPERPDQLSRPERPGQLSRSERPEKPPRAIVAPHAGYIYSGPIAASAFAAAAELRRGIERVVVLGPSHFVPFDGLATSGAEVFETPLGEIGLDRDAEAELESLPQVAPFPAAHSREHAIEVELPFVQVVLGAVPVVALVVGDADAGAVAEALERVWSETTLVVISSDLSHYLDYDSARRLDAETAELIAGLSTRSLGSERACGCRAIDGLLAAARSLDLEARTLDLRNSGDTAGPRDQVVGYGAFAFFDA